MKLTVPQIAVALRKQSGNVKQTADVLGVSRTTLYRHISASPTLRDVMQESREELADIAESALRLKVLQGDITAIIFTLKTQGRRRGYNERDVHLNIDVSALTDEQLNRLKNGDDPYEVISG